MAGWLRRWRRDPAPIPDALWQAVISELRLLDTRDDAQRTRLRSLVARFLARKAFTGARGLDVTDRMRLLVATQACLPLLNLDFAWLGGWHEVILYPGQFRVRRHDHDEDTAVVTEWDDELAGESWSHGPLVLSWRDVEEDLADPHSGCNVVMHEIAHKLDMADGESDGVPPIRELQRRREWKRVMTAAYEALVVEVEAGRETPMDPYAAEAPDEYFAVATEYYFSAPGVLREHYPQVHAQLAAFYGE